jgi:hypothetical protein
MTMNPQFRMVPCGLCGRRYPQSRSTRSTINGRNAWICAICVNAMQTETTAQGVRQASEQRGRKR